MSLLAEYGPRYGGVLVLILALIVLVHFRRRRERRLASGWRLEESDKNFVKNLNDLGTALMLFYLAALMSGLNKIAGGIYILAMITLLTPREKWVAPDNQNALQQNCGSESCR